MYVIPTPDGQLSFCSESCLITFKNSNFKPRLQKVPNEPVLIVGVTAMETPSMPASGDERPRLVVQVVTDEDIPLSSHMKDLTR